MRDPLNTWKSEYANIPEDGIPPAGAIALASMVSLRVMNKLAFKSSTLTVSPPAAYTFAQPVFLAGLLALVVPTPDKITPATIIATAWSSAVLASPMLISPGANLNPPPPGTNGIAAFAVCVIDPPSVVLAQAQIIKDLILAKPTGDKKESQIPKSFYEAFGKITYTITGADTKPPPSGPTPFVLPLTGVE